MTSRLNVYISALRLFLYLTFFAGKQFGEYNWQEETLRESLTDRIAWIFHGARRHVVEQLAWINLARTSPAKYRFLPSSVRAHGSMDNVPSRAVICKSTYYLASEASPSPSPPERKRFSYLSGMRITPKAHFARILSPAYKGTPSIQLLRQLIILEINRGG